MKHLTELASCVIAEEGGLVTVFLDRDIVPKRLASLPGAHRVRLNPPAALLREDGHVFDLDGACGFVERRVLAPLMRAFPSLVLSDAVIGLSRFSLGLRHHDDVDAVEEAIEALDIAPWEIEELAIAKGTERELRLLGDVDLMSRPLKIEVPAAAAELVRRVRELPRAGSFVELAALDTQHPKTETVTKALHWVDSQLVELNRQLLPIDGLPGEVRIALKLNCHPECRSFSFVIDDPEDIPIWVPELDNALADWLGAPNAVARRVPGILWNAGNLRGKYELVDLNVDS